jgi:hypothetical protein
MQTAALTLPKTGRPLQPVSVNLLEFLTPKIARNASNKKKWRAGMALDGEAATKAGVCFTPAYGYTPACGIHKVTSAMEVDVVLTLLRKCKSVM